MMKSKQLTVLDHMLDVTVNLVSVKGSSYELCMASVLSVGLFYYTLANLRPELRSSHKAIQLIACVSCPVLSKYGFKPILEPFIKDVNILAKVSSLLWLTMHAFLLITLGWFISFF